MDLITNTQLDIDNKRKTENPKDTEDTKHNEKETKEERKCLKDETILDVKDGNNLEEEEKEHSAQSITIDSPVGISESILDDKVMSDTTTDVSTNVGDRKIEHTGVYFISHRKHIYLYFLGGDIEANLECRFNTEKNKVMQIQT